MANKPMVRIATTALAEPTRDLGRPHIGRPLGRSGRGRYLLRFVTWNMGCGPRMSQYRKTHAEAWRYLLNDLRPDVAFVQEALLGAHSSVRLDGTLYWSHDRTSDSGTAVFVRGGIASSDIQLRSAGGFLAAAEVALPGHQVLCVSAHVGPGDYRANITSMFDDVEKTVKGKRFVLGGDFNAARHIDDVYGGDWYRHLFDSLRPRGFFDCHWSKHGVEKQSFWGRQAREAYQDDHVFVDSGQGSSNFECDVIDNREVRSLSDHGPVAMETCDG